MNRTKKLAGYSLEEIADILNQKLVDYKLKSGSQYGWIIIDYASASMARYIYSSNNYYSIDGVCGSKNGSVCRKKECCSKHGYCGSSGSYCGVGCQGSYGKCGYEESYGTTKNERCGHINGMSCHTNYCCSDWGYCGNSNSHCKSGCQSAFGMCK